MPATFLELALFTLAAASTGYARPNLNRDLAGSTNNTDVQVRDGPMHGRAFVDGYLYGRKSADESITARELVGVMDGLERRMTIGALLTLVLISGQPTEF